MKLSQILLENSSILNLYMPDGGEQGVIQVWQQGSNSWAEFRGTPYSQWDKDDTPSPVQQVHDALEGWHATVLHTDSVLQLFPHHPDYNKIRAMFDQQNTT